jgi:hypothetical protein
MSYQDSNDTEHEDSKFTTILAWLAAAAATIASIAGLASFV